MELLQHLNDVCLVLALVDSRSNNFCGLYGNNMCNDQYANLIYHLAKLLDLYKC